MKNFLLYGANGYTAGLIIQYANQYGLQPILAGRNENEINELGAKHNLPFLVFDLGNKQALTEALKKVDVVLHAAGPFSETYRQMIEACLETKTHYTDINGDISVFEAIKKYDKQAVEAGIMLMPGVGFDVVPTDCIAVQLKNKMPDATHLQLAFASVGGAISHGTAMTMASRLGEGGAVRKNGKIVNRPLGHEGMWVDFGKRKMYVMSIPWGDISTAHFSTGIPNITTYTGIAPKTYKMLKWQSLFNWLLRKEFVRKFIRNKIKARPAGPSDEMRATAKGYVWGKVTNGKGEEVEATLSGPEGYTLTAYSSLIILHKILDGTFKTGYQTPASCYGPDLVYEVPGVERG